MVSVTERMFSRLVGLWHESDTDKPIYEWMGLTAEEYGAIVTCEPMTAAIDQAVASFNGGIVRLDDSANPRGFVDRYMPREAMRRAITPVIIAERERCARVAEDWTMDWTREIAHVPSDIAQAIRITQ